MPWPMTGAIEMFEKERRSKDRFFSRLSSEGKRFMMKDDFDYFKEEQETPEEESENSFAAETDKLSTDNGKETDGRELSEDAPKQGVADVNANREGADSNMGFWKKIRNCIKG